MNSIKFTLPLFCFILSVWLFPILKASAEAEDQIGIGLVGQAREKQTAADNVIYKLLQEGLALKLGGPSASPLSNAKNLLVTVPVTLSLSDQIVEILSEAIKAFHGNLGQPEPIIFIQEVRGTNTFGNHLVGERNQSSAFGAPIRFSSDPRTEQYFLDQIPKISLLLSWRYTGEENDFCSISNVEIRRLLAAKRLKVIESDQNFGPLKDRLLVATLPPINFPLEPFHPDMVLLIFSKASFQVERELAVSTVEKLKEVTGKLVIGSEETNAGAKCRISKVTKNNSIEEEAQNTLKELLPVVKRYKQAASRRD